MTEQQYNEYKTISAELETLKDFLFWCGKKYKNNLVGLRETRLIKKKKRRFDIGRVAYGAIESTEVKIPVILQERIIEVVEQYADELQKKLDEL